MRSRQAVPEREQYIANYIETLENLGKEDIHLVCYNFMPVFDWTRTELARVRQDGSTVLAYTQEAVDALEPGEDVCLDCRGYERRCDAGLGARENGTCQRTVYAVPGCGR